MSAVLAPPPPAVAAVPASPPVPQPFRWTIRQYRQLAGMECFRDVKTMLLHGEIFTMVMPNPPHDTALAYVEEWLRVVFAAGHHVRTQKGFDIGTRNDPGPDVAVVPGAIRDYSKKTPTAAVLVVEVADSTLAVDTTTKAELYATAGVPDYWVLDLNGRQLQVFRDPAPLPEGLGATAYRTHQTFGPDDTVAPLAAPGHPVRVADLLP